MGEIRIPPTSQLLPLAPPAAVRLMLRKLTGDISAAAIAATLEDHGSLWQECLSPTKKALLVLACLPLREEIRALTLNDVIAGLQTERPDLLAVVLQHPEGAAWLADQVLELKHILGG